MTTEAAERVYIRDAAELLDRRMATLRKWEQTGVLPLHLRPHRGERGWRYWTPEQIEGIRAWLRESDRRPGKGLPHYDPTEKAVEEAIASMRKPRRCVICEKSVKKGEEWLRLRGKPVHVECLGLDEFEDEEEASEPETSGDSETIESDDD